jgi:AcrR family transcriptional regulator
LIYRKFKSKEEIFGAVLKDIFETQYRAAVTPLEDRIKAALQLFLVMLSCLYR